MKVRTLGFNLQDCSEASLNDFFQHILENTYRENPNIFAVISRGEYWVGLILTIRDQRSFCKMQDQGETFTISMQELERGENPVEFNFFLVNKTTLRGVYLHYWHSRSLSSSLTFVKTLYDRFKDQKKNNELQALNISNYNTRKLYTEEIKAIKSKFRQSLQFSIWVKPQSFSDYVNQLTTVKNFEIEVESLVVEEPSFRPLASMSKSVKQKFNFTSTDNHLAAIKAAVLDSVQSIGDNLIKAKVTGVDPAGVETTYSLANNIDELSSYDYDELVAGLQIQSDSIESSLLQSNLVTTLLALTQSPQISVILNTPC